ncbi:MAG: DUF3987 domain-containing protein [Rubrivivax sp.]|nr:DUF3987 domain-containing protein [Rubrivivax sp.]
MASADLVKRIADDAERYRRIRCGPDASAQADWPPIKRLPAAEPGEINARPFPFESLGRTLGPAARVIADRVQAPAALAAGSVLAAAAVASQAHADVLMPHGQRAPLSLFILSAAESGDRKSATDQVALRPIEDHRRTAVRADQAALCEWKAARAKERADEPPPLRSLTVPQGTPEGLHNLLRRQSQVGLFSAEGAELLCGHGLRDERRAAGIAWLVKAWGGDPLERLTRGEDLSVLLGRRVSMHLMIQPVILRQVLADPLAQGQGLVARCLIAAPPSLAGSRMFQAHPPVEACPELGLYRNRLQDLLGRDLSVMQASDGHELSPRTLRLNEQARALWIEAYNEVERHQGAEGRLRTVKPWASKFGEHAARIAGVIALTEDPEATSIDLRIMESALQVADYYLDQQVVLMPHATTSLEDLLDFMLRSAPSIDHVRVLQSAPHSVRILKARGINRLLERLAEHSYIRRSGRVWEVNPNA